MHPLPPAPGVSHRPIVGGNDMKTSSEYAKVCIHSLCHVSPLRPHARHLGGRRSPAADAAVLAALPNGVVLLELIGPGEEETNKSDCKIDGCYSKVRSLFPELWEDSAAELHALERLLRDLHVRVDGVHPGLDLLQLLCGSTGRFWETPTMSSVRNVGTSSAAALRSKIRSCGQGNAMKIKVHKSV